MKWYRLLFSLLWLIVWIVPLFHMNTSEITEQENRTLAKFPETRKKDKPNYEFGKEFEGWLGDRFWGRDQLIDAHFQTMYKINGRIENDKAFIGDDGWMFMKDGIVNVPSIEKQREKIEKDADILKRFDDKFKGKNVPVYLVLIPDRNQLYQKYWEKYYTQKPKLDYGDELIKALKDYPNIHIIYPKEEFIEAMGNEHYEPLFQKKDTHLSHHGYSILGEYFIKRLNDNLPLNVRWNRFSGSKEEIENNNISANLLFPIREKRKYNTIFLGVQNNNSYQEIENFKALNKDNKIYPGYENIIYRVALSKNIKRKELFISIGNCYSEYIFGLMRGIFQKSIWIRTDFKDYGEEAYANMKGKIKELSLLKKNQAIITILSNDYSILKEVM